MDPGSQKSIFGQKIESSNFQPKFAQNWCLDISNRFLVEKRKIRIFEQKWILGVKNRFLVKKLKVQFFAQNRPKKEL